MRNKKTAIISGIVILEICFFYFGDESLAGLGGPFMLFLTIVCLVKKLLAEMNIAYGKPKRF